MQAEASLETNPASTLSLNFLSLELGENRVLLSKPPGLWYFVMTARAD